MMTLGYCNNASLQMIYPNLTCKSREEADAIIPYTYFILAHLEQYFDVEDFVKPIKYSMKAYQFQPGFN